MKKILSKIFMLVAFGFITAAALAAPVQSLNGIVAIINQEPIMQSDLDQAMHDDRLQLQAMNQPIPPATVFRKQVLDRLIDIRMQLQLAKNDDITVTQSEVDGAVARIAKGNNTSVAGFFARLQQGGIAKDQYLQQIKQQLIISKLQSQVVDGKVNVSDADAREFIVNHTKQNSVYKINDILLPLPENADATVTKKLQAQAEQLRNGLVHSSPVSAIQLIAKSGAAATVLDYRPLNNYPNLFIPLITSLTQGKYSQVIAAGNGFHILQLLSKKHVSSGAGNITLDQAKQFLGQQQAQKIINDWLQKLRATAFVKIYN